MQELLDGKTYNCINEDKFNLEICKCRFCDCIRFKEDFKSFKCVENVVPFPIFYFQFL